MSIDSETQQLLTYAYDPSQLRKVSVPLAAIQSCSSMAVSTDLRDACIYILSRAVAKRIKHSQMSSIKVRAFLQGLRTRVATLLPAHAAHCSSLLTCSTFRMLSDSNRMHADSMFARGMLRMLVDSVCCADGRAAGDCE